MSIELSTANSVIENATTLPPGKLPSTELLSEEVADIITVYVVIATAICAIVGVFGNLVDIIVFYRIGLDRPSNICFFSLAIADLISLSWILLNALSQNPLVEDGRILIPLSDLNIFLSTVGNSLTAFAAWVTTIMSLERSCCIVFPLKVKQIFTKRVTFILLLSMLIYQVATAAPFYFSFRVARVPSPYPGWSYIVMDRRSHNKELAVLSKTLSFSVPTMVCFFTVVMATVFLIKSFMQSREARQAMVGSKSEQTSSKDARVIKTVIVICTIFICGYFLKVANYLVSMIYPTFHVFDPFLGNVCSIFMILANFFHSISCSVNIVVYFRMNSAFRQKARDTFCRKK